MSPYLSSSSVRPVSVQTGPPSIETYVVGSNVGSGGMTTGMKASAASADATSPISGITRSGDDFRDIANLPARIGGRLDGACLTKFVRATHWAAEPSRAR